MNMNANQVMGDKERLQDSIASQKLITSSYNTFASECVNMQLKNTFLSILDDEQKIQSELFQEMQGKGWYQTEPADGNKITQARQKYSAI